MRELDRKVPNLQFNYQTNTDQHVQSFVGCNITPCDSARHWSDIRIPHTNLIMHVSVIKLQIK